jgi:hypothetical protein
MMRPLRVVLVAMIAAVSSPVRADTIRAHSTTLFNWRQVPYTEPRAGAVRDLEFQLETNAPIFEIVSVTASDVSASFAEEVEIAVSTWGAVDLADIRRWQNGAPGTDRRVSGDLDVAYVKGELLDRRLILRLGRQMVVEGNARMVHLDGGQLRLRLPGGFGLSGFAGAPVPPRFSQWGGELMTGNHRANFATGARASYLLLRRGELGLSWFLANDRGDLSRHEAGADLRVWLPARFEVLGNTTFSVIDAGFAEGNLALSWRPAMADVWGLVATVDWRHTRPDLFLPRTSILSVFSDEQRNEIGGAVGLRPVETIWIDADYHALLEPEGDTGDELGHRARVKGVWSPSRRHDVGLEGVFFQGGTLSSTRGEEEDENGYWLARAFGAARYGPLEVTADVISYFLNRELRSTGEDLSLTAGGTVGYRFGGAFQGFKALVGGRGGTTPFLESHFDVIAKLVYDQTYVTREVP